MPKRIDITGERFGRLVAMKYAYTDKEKKAVWECVCDCGTHKMVRAKDLKSGNTKSCGCAKVERARNLKYKDGRCKERLHGVWSTMLQRCRCKTDNEYRFYGAMGITVCDEWMDYRNFKKWAYENGYDENAAKGECTIDRIDSTGNYEPKNCRWVSMEIQRKNKRKPIEHPRDKETGRFLKCGKIRL